MLQNTRHETIMLLEINFMLTKKIKCKILFPNYFYLLKKFHIYSNIFNFTSITNFMLTCTYFHVNNLFFC